MDTIKRMQLAHEASKYIKKDLKHTIIVGVIACSIILIAGLYYKWSAVDMYLYAGIMAAIFFARAMFEIAKPFYLVEVKEYSLKSVPYQRIKDSFDYFLTIQQRGNVYACKRNLFIEAEQKLVPNIPLDFQIHDNTTYEALQDNEEENKLVLVLSATKTLVGCFINHQYYPNGL